MAKKQPAKPSHGGWRAGAGRKPLQDGVESVIVPIRMTPDQRDKFHRIGGATRVRNYIDSAKEPQ